MKSRTTKKAARASRAASSATAARSASTAVTATSAGSASPPRREQLARRTDAALRPATPVEVYTSRALDQELDWFFSYAEGALSRQNVAILPGYAAVKVLATEPTDEACRAQASSLALAVRGCLHGLPGPHAAVLRAAYTARRWPSRVLEAWAHLAGVVVRISLEHELWPPRSGKKGLEEAAAARLSTELAQPGRVPVARWRARAERLLGGAIVAYAQARAKGTPSPDAGGGGAMPTTSPVAPSPSGRCR